MKSLLYPLYAAASWAMTIFAIISEQNTPVAWDGTNDRVLDVGQFTKDSFTSATSMPLHIACGDGQIYEMEIVGTYTPAAGSTASYLEPNNTTYASAFSHFYTLFNYSATTVTPGGVAESFFSLDTALGTSIQSGSCVIFTSTANKKGYGFSKGETTTIEGASQFTVRWNDTTTVWSSLGTVIMPNAWTGQIVVRRIA